MSLVKESTSRIEAALKASGSKPLLMFSGGKDSIVVASMLSEILGGDSFQSFCEVSLVPGETIFQIKQTAKQLGLDVYWSNWLADPREYALKYWEKFAPPNKWKASDLDSVRHWKSIPSFAKAYKPSVMFFGRRTQENNVSDHTYYKKNSKALQCHPIYDWKHEDVWSYIKGKNITYPKCYDEGSSHLYVVLSLAWQAYRESNNYNDYLAVWHRYLPTYFLAAKEIDSRAFVYKPKFKL